MNWIKWVDIDVSTGDVLSTKTKVVHDQVVYRTTLAGDMLDRAHTLECVLASTAADRSTWARLHGQELPQPMINSEQ